MTRDNEKTPIYKKWWFWMIVIVLLFIVIYAASPKQPATDENVATNSSSEEENNWSDAMKKCTVMEAVDIQKTGIGRESDNVFDDAKETCNSWYTDWGDDAFYSAVYADWEDRKEETIEDKPLTYYLDILNW